MSVGERLSTAESPVSREEDDLARVLAAYLSEVEAGRPVNPDEWVERHPAIAERLRACLKGLNLVEEVAGAIGVGALTRRPGDDGPRLGDFQILRSLGRGGMGVVYEALEGALGRRVALKVLPFGAAIDPRRLARFRVEAQAAAQLHHPHIIPVYSVGSEAGVHFYAMQLIQGATVAELIAELRRMEGPTGDRKRAGALTNSSRSHDELGGVEPADRARLTGTEGSTETSGILSSIWMHSPAFSREAARLGLQAAQALEHAHQNGVLHRDVKPSNLMVDSTGHLWVADFGLARFQGEGSLTASGDLLGTLRYMSPEQALANRGVVDERTDVYSLGATLYELITLRPAFEGSNRQSLLRRIAQDEPRRPRALKPAIPIDLETIVIKAMAKDPVSRYSAASELAEDLQRFLDDQPILARKPGPLERLTRLARRHSAVVVAVVPLLFVMIIGLALGIALVLAKQAKILTQQAEIRVKKEDAERSHAEARQQRDEARRAVDEMYTQVAQSWLGSQINPLPLQRDFLQKALAYYEKFALERDADPAIRAGAGWAFFRVGDIQRRLGKLAEAEQGFRRAVATLEGLRESMPTSFELVEPLAASYGGLGELLDDTGRSDEAKNPLRRSVELTRTLIEKTPVTSDTRSMLATQYLHLGTSLSRGGQYRESEEAYQKAIALEKVGSKPTEFITARSTENLAIVLQKQGKTNEAERLFREAALQFGSLSERDPSMAVYRGQLAESLLNLGHALPKGSQEIENVFRRARGLFERLATDAPLVSDYRKNLAITLLNLGKLFLADGRLREAEEATRSSRALLEVLTKESPTFLLNQERLAQCLTTLSRIRSRDGQKATALADAERARDLYDALEPEALDLRADMAWNLSHLAALLEDSNNGAAAEKHRRLALDQFETLASKAPGRLEFRSDLAYNLELAALTSARTGRTAEAERDFRRAIEILERLLSQAPEKTQDRFHLSQAAHHFGELLFQTGQLEEAERVGRIAYRAYERLFLENYQSEEMLRECAICLKNIGLIEVKRGKPAEAERSYLKSLKLFDSLSPKAALELSVREQRGAILDSLGDISRGAGRLKDAESRFREGIKNRESLVADAPSNAGYRNALAITTSHLGVVLAALGEIAEAGRVLRRGVELQETATKTNPSDPKIPANLLSERKTLLMFLLDQGAHAEGAGVAADLLRDYSPSDHSDTLSLAGASLAACSELASHDVKLSPTARAAVALSYAQRARQVFTNAADSGKNDAATINLVWFLSVFPIAEVRDTARAARLARELSKRSPTRSDSWTILGAACYYSGDWQESLAAFQKAFELEQGKIKYWDFYRAMTEWRLDHKEEARKCFDRAQGWMKSNPTTQLHTRIRAEAAALLGLPDPVTPPQKDPKPEAQPIPG